MSTLPTTRSTLTEQQIAAIVNGDCDDVFSMLGQHSHPSGKGMVLRAYIPGATNIEVIAQDSGQKVTTLNAVYAEGLFEKMLGNRGRPFDYFLRVTTKDNEYDTEDPYRFPACLQAKRLHLSAEGTEERAYQWLGANQRSIQDRDGILFAVWAPAAKRVSVQQQQSLKEPLSLYEVHPGIPMVAEESTAWPGVSRPVNSGGLGFGYKWNMGWMNDSLRYMERDPVHRQYHHDEMTFAIAYAWSENFVLATIGDPGV